MYEMEHLCEVANPLNADIVWYSTLSKLLPFTIHDLLCFRDIKERLVKNFVGCLMFTLS